MPELEQIIKKEEKEKRSVYERHYKLMAAFSISLLILAIVYLLVYYGIHNEFVKKDISLTGGIVLTLYGDYGKSTLEQEVKKFTDAYSIKYTKDLYSGKVASSIIEARISEEQAKAIIQDLGIANESYSLETTSPALGKSFSRQLIIALLIAFIFMSIVVFILFRTFVPSIAVILAALTDIIVTLAVINLAGKSLSTAGIVALLMLIGYSVDTDIMLTTRVVKRRESPLGERVRAAFKTGITMSGTTVIATLVAFLLSTSLVLKEIFFILTIGVFVDILSTWLGNASIITWYVKRKYKE